MEKDLLPIGKVVKPHGIRGKIKVYYFGGDPSLFPHYREIFIKNQAGLLQSYEVLEAVPQPPRLILQLKGIEGREAVEPLMGKEILIEKRALPDLEEGEYYWFDIMGMVVETERGKKIGRVKEIFSTKAYDIYVVEGKKKEIFLPATEEVIQSIDIKKGRMQVVRMKGLWEEEDEV
jgi:16S rRNA processing protein RimM